MHTQRLVQQKTWCLDRMLVGYLCLLDMGPGGIDEGMRCQGCNYQRTHAVGSWDYQTLDAPDSRIVPEHFQSMTFLQTEGRTLQKPTQNFWLTF